MPATLPGMPLAASDVHVCYGIGDGQGLPPPPAPVRPAPYQEWIVLSQCGRCNRRTGHYCDRHDTAWVWRTRWGENNDAPRVGLAVPRPGRS